jgi:hypothetical protein
MGKGSSSSITLNSLAISAAARFAASGLCVIRDARSFAAARPLPLRKSARMRCSAISYASTGIHPETQRLLSRTLQIRTEYLTYLYRVVGWAVGSAVGKSIQGRKDLLKQSIGADAISAKLNYAADFAISSLVQHLCVSAFASSATARTTAAVPANAGPLDKFAPVFRRQRPGTYREECGK